MVIDSHVNELVQCRPRPPVVCGDVQNVGLSVDVLTTRCQKDPFTLKNERYIHELIFSKQVLINLSESFMGAKIKKIHLPLTLL